jgi:hypothetical protein
MEHYADYTSLLDRSAVVFYMPTPQRLLELGYTLVDPQERKGEEHWIDQDATPKRHILLYADGTTDLKAGNVMDEAMDLFFGWLPSRKFFDLLMDHVYWAGY